MSNPTFLTNFFYVRVTDFYIFVGIKGFQMFFDIDYMLSEI